MQTSQWTRWIVAWVTVTAAVACGNAARNNDPSPECGSPECETPNAGEGGSAGETQTVTSGAPATFGERLGRTCSSAEDCGGTLRCLRSDEDFFNGTGAPAGGLCTSTCFTDADCEALGPNAVCGSLAEDPLAREAPAVDAPRLCMQRCSVGGPSGASKCHGRTDLACRPFVSPSSEKCQKDGSCPNGGQCYRDICRHFACGPRCNADADCDEGRYCNTQTGLCDVRKLSPVPIGASCNPDRSFPGVCGNGTCLSLFDDDGVRLKSMCTHSCTMGQSCGEGAACTLPRFHAIVGDIAYCNETCNCNEDCRHPEDACVPWEAEHVADYYGTKGSCQPQERDETSLSCASVIDR